MNEQALSNLPGLWNTALTEQLAIKAHKEYSQVVLVGERAFVVETLPEKQGASFICCYNNDKREVITPDGYSVQSKVHCYGGRSWCLAGDNLVFVNADDQQLYLQAFTYSAQEEIPSSLPRQLTNKKNSRFLEPIWDEKRNRLIVVEELHPAEADNQDALRVENRLSAVCLETGNVSIIHQGNDFYTYPVISRGGDQFAFISWNHPHQPWVCTQLTWASFNEQGDIESCFKVVDESEDIAVSQPQFKSSDELAYIADSTGWWNLYVFNKGGEPVVSTSSASTSDAITSTALISRKADQMTSPWQSGYYQYGFNSAGIINIALKHEGVDLYCDSTRIHLSDVSYIKEMSVTGNGVLLIAAGPKHQLGLIQISLNAHQSAETYRIVNGFDCQLAEAEISSPKPYVFSSEHRQSYGYFYPAANSAFKKYDKTPLIVFLHGGPTAATYPVYSNKVQYWTQRGFSVIDLNYTGSSNYGRDYRLALKHQWGQVELDDIRQAIQALVQHESIDEQCIFIRGSSAGGYTALIALCELDCFAGGASLYGVTDPIALDAVTHKFESHYLSWLIGDTVLDKKRFDAYAPINKIDALNTPVIFFQGEQDKVVVPEQTRDIVEKLKHKRVSVEVIYFQDEGHGFKKPENQMKALQAECCFYQEIIRCQKKACKAGQNDG